MKLVKQWLKKNEYNERKVAETIKAKDKIRKWKISYFVKVHSLKTCSIFL